MDMEEIRVQVPTTRVTEFYRWFADWRDGKIANEPSRVAESGAGVTELESRLDAAVRWWKSLKRNERGVWGMWLDNAPELVPADRIVDELGLKGPRDIPGILSWSGRKGEKVGFNVTWRFTEDPDGGAPLYGIEDVEYAALLRRARDAS